MAIVASLALIVSSLVLCFGNTPTPVDDSDNEGYFYSPSDGRYIILGPYWHPDAPDCFSVRYIGFSPDVPDNIADIYICVQDIYADQSLVLPFQMYNHENRTLYFTIEDNGTDLTGQVADYVLAVEEMGSVGGSGELDDTWTYTITVDNIPSSLGATENMDTIYLRVSSWEDSEYSVLYTRDNFVINIHYIDREDTGWTIVDEDNFDDGTAQGWSAEKGSQTMGDVSATATDVIYRSENYSLMITADMTYSSGQSLSVTACPYKSLTVSGTSAYLIASVRTQSWDSCEFGIYENDSKIASPVEFSTNVWYQMVIPLTVDGNAHKVEMYDLVGRYNIKGKNYAYIDDVYVIQR